MRVFELNTFCGVKSTGRITTEIAKLVEQDGGECRIGYGAGDVPREFIRFAYKIGHPLERKLHGAMRKLLDAEGYGSIFGTERLIREMRSFNPDIVHLHNLHGCYINLRMLFLELERLNVPVLWTLHDCWPFTGHCAYFDYSGCEKWKTMCFQCPQQRSYPICIGLDGSHRNYLFKRELFTIVSNITFVTPCEWMKQPLSQSFLSSYPVRVIPNGVDRAVFHPTHGTLRERYHLDNQQIILAVASEWDERKGLRYLLEVRKQMPDTFTIVVVGLSEQQIDQLPKGMLGISHTENTIELAEWYTLASCFVNPTMEDNMPMVNLEALACGTPIAVFNTGGCSEAPDEMCGIIVEKGNVDALAAAIILLCAECDQRRTYCIQRSEMFDSATTFAVYIQLYKELCQ